MDGLFEGGQGVLADQHDLALLVQGDGEGTDVGVLAREFEYLCFELGESGKVHRGGREIRVAAEGWERGQVYQILVDRLTFVGHHRFHFVHLLVAFLGNVRREQGEEA